MKKKVSRANKDKWNKLSKELRTKTPYCEYCKATNNLQVHHIIGKFWGKSIFRFDIHNLIVVCPSCHFLWHRNPILTMDWLKSNRTLDHNYLLRVSKTIK